MSGKILILGGYGNFGKRIAVALTKKQLAVIIAGRDKNKAEALAAALPQGLAEAASFDVQGGLASALEILKPVVVINTCGPFQNSNYDAARICIAHGVHYIDLADGRDFVTGITALDAEAKKNNVSIISGASTVPGLSSAVIEHFLPEFSGIDSLIYGISPGQKAERGLATTRGILTYVGKRLKPFAGHARAYGWQDIYQQEYPELGKRWMANCDIPDLDLLPARYAIKNISFSAGLELGFLHLGLWALSWAMRLGIPFNLPRYADMLLSASNLLNWLGSADGGMHVIIRGKSTDGKAHERRWFIVAKNGDGPQIPCMPAIILAAKLSRGEKMEAGAYPCLGLVALEDYMAELSAFEVHYYSA